jgi:hypothetical protein
VEGIEVDTTITATATIRLDLVAFRTMRTRIGAITGIEVDTTTTATRIRLGLLAFRTAIRTLIAATLMREPTPRTRVSLCPINKMARDWK